MAKANLVVDGKEITVLFEIQDGEPGDCFYCHMDGAVEQLAVVTEIDVDGVKLGSRSKLYHDAETRLKQVMFSGRAMHVGTSCEDKWIEEFHADKNVAINTP